MAVQGRGAGGAAIGAAVAGPVAGEAGPTAGDPCADVTADAGGSGDARRDVDAQGKGDVATGTAAAAGAAAAGGEDADGRPRAPHSRASVWSGGSSRGNGRGTNSGVAAYADSHECS